MIKINDAKHYKKIVSQLQIITIIIITKVHYNKEKENKT